MKIKGVIQAVGEGINKNSPSILIGLGVSGFVGSLAMAIQATPKAQLKIENALYSKYIESEKDVETSSFAQYMARSYKEPYSPDNALSYLNPKETIAIVYDVYIPTMLLASLSIASILIGNRIHVKRAATLAGLYSLAESSLKNYQDRVLDTVGKNENEKIQAAVAQDAIDKNPPTELNTYNVGGGTDLCYEMYTGRYFWGSAENIRSTVNDFNHLLLQENVRTLNELYYEFGLPYVEVGNRIGWDSENGLIEVVLTARVASDNKTPCLVLDFARRPLYIS